MADERLAQARALIKAKQYQQARRTLTGVDHPTARAWLAKLDEIAPEDDPFAAVSPIKPNRRINWAAVALLALVLVAFAVGAVWYVGYQLRGADARLQQDSDAFSTRFAQTWIPPTPSPTPRGRGGRS